MRAPAFKPLALLALTSARFLFSLPLFLSLYLSRYLSLSLSLALSISSPLDGLVGKQTGKQPGNQRLVGGSFGWLVGCSVGLKLIGLEVNKV